MKYVSFNILNVLRDCQTSDFRFKTILKDGKVYNLLDGGPRKALEDHCINSKVSQDEGGKSVLRMIVCGGDGSIGWVLSVMDMMKIPIGKRRFYSTYTTNNKTQYCSVVIQTIRFHFKNILECRPAIGIIPLGTGNDLSRVLKWGGKYVYRSW